MSKWKNKDGKTVRRETIPKGSQWTWWTIEMMESPAFRALSLSAHRVVARIRVELANHGGKDNGKLPVTFLDFEKYGVHRHAIAPAIREAEALGWIRVAQYGRAGTGDYRAPNMFALTHMPVNEMKPTNNWDKIETMADAEIIAKKARKTLNTSAGKRTSTSVGKRTANNKSPHPKTALQEPAETAPLSIYREGTDRSRPGWQGSEGNPPPAHAPIGHNAGPPLAPEPEPTGLMEWTAPILTEMPYTDELRRLYAEAVPTDNDLSIPEFLRRTVQ